MLGVGGLSLSPAMAKSQDHKITICHIPPGNVDNPQEITIDLHAWENGHTPHNAHADDFVVTADHQCGLDDSGTTTTTTTTTIVTPVD